MIDRKMRKNEKEGVMQRENERIIYHLMHFDEKDKEWSESFYGRVQRRIQNSFCLLNLSLYIKISEDIPKTDRYLWCQTKYRDMEQV